MGKKKKCGCRGKKEGGSSRPVPPGSSTWDQKVGTTNETIDKCFVERGVRGGREGTTLDEGNPFGNREEKKMVNFRNPPRGRLKQA